MLHLITTTTDHLIEYIKDDPVRPEISKEFRVSDCRYIAAIVEGQRPNSMVCVSLHDFVPSSIDDLSNTVENPTVAVFYSIWSYKPGSGAALLRLAVKDIKERNPGIVNFVTLSPKTEMARRFHLKNGALVLRENDSTVNYQYLTV
jgi:hypothetical protein